MGKSQYSQRSDAVSDPGDRGPAVQVGRGIGRDRTYSHTHLDTGEDRQMSAKMTENSAEKAVTAARVVSFHRMEDGTREDYALLAEFERDYSHTLPDRILAALCKLDDGLQGYPVSRLAHSLQTATRALRDGADDELIVAALIHDLGDDLAPENHAQVA